MKADKGNSLVVMDRSDYDSKMENLLQGETTYTVICKSPFKKVERDLNAMLLSLKNQGKLLEKTYHKLHSSDAIPPVIRGSIKHHKVNNPLRPIVTSTDSALYNTSKFLSRILSPLQNQNGFSVTNSTQFRNEIYNMTISEDETMVSFDVVSLFTAIPVDNRQHSSSGEWFYLLIYLVFIDGLLWSWEGLEPIVVLTWDLRHRSLFR